MSKEMYYDFRPEDVITQTIFSPANSPLPFARLEASEFFDRMLPTPVVWILGQDGQ